MANESLKTLSVTDIMRMREQAARGSQVIINPNDATPTADPNAFKAQVDNITTEAPAPVEAKQPGHTPVRTPAKNAKVPTGETGDLYMKETQLNKDIDIVVAGKSVKVSAEQMNEFLARTAHNNVGELTENDRRIVENMELGIHAEAKDDKESLKLGQNAVAGMINTSKKLISESATPNPDQKRLDTGAIQGGDSPAVPEDEDEEDIYPAYGQTDGVDSNIYDENRYEDADEDDTEEVVVHKPAEEKTESIAEYMARMNGGDKRPVVLVEGESAEKEKEDVRIETFKAGNTGVADLKLNGFEEGLNTIKIVPFNGKKIIKQRLNNQINSKKTPVCALSSNIFCEVSGFSYSDLTQLNAERNDGYIDRRRQLEILYKKILNPNVPLTFDTFIRTTSIYDEEAFYFGAFKSTFGDKVKIPLTCQHEDCQHSFTYEIDADDLIISKDYITMGDKVKDIMSMHNIRDLEESDVNKVKRFRLSSGHIIDICHPSLHTLLEKTIKLVINSPLSSDQKYGEIIDLLPFISALYVPVVPEGDTRLASEVPPAELNYIEISIDEGDKLKVSRAKLTALCDEILTLGYDSVMEISKFIMDRITSIQEQFSMGLVDVVCPKCGRPLGARSNGHENFIPIKIRELIFLNQLHQINEVSMR